MKRFFCDQIKNSNVILRGSEHYHLSKVLRLKVCDKVILNDGHNVDFFANIEEINKDYTNLKIYDKKINDNETENKYTLFQAIIKSEKKDLIVKKAVEIGVSEIVFFKADRSIGNVNLERLQKISIEACKQCERAKKVNIKVINLLEKEHLNFFEKVYLCYERGGNSFSNVFKPAKSNAIIIGPEGGFTQNEIKKFNDYEFVSLGKRILRSETASIIALTLNMFLNNDL